MRKEVLEQSASDESVEVDDVEEELFDGLSSMSEE